LAPLEVYSKIKDGLWLENLKLTEHETQRNP